MWVLRVRNFGPLMIVIDSTGRNFYEERRRIVEENMKRAAGLV
jgi:tartrate dehydratase beta subunit/fumarate hydratase class I family protein